MSKIINYRALHSHDTMELSTAVEYWIARGYQPLGGISVSKAMSDDSVYEQDVFAQAMVEYEAIAALS